MKRLIAFFVVSSLWTSYAFAIDCANPVASKTLLWPPNHKLISIEITNLTGPDEPPATVVITSITQDELVNGLGDGDTSPDGFGVGTSTVQLRAERSGLGNGRVYGVGFSASNDGGRRVAADAVDVALEPGTCQGFFVVGVPHDQGPGAIPIDDGQFFDSTLP
jgi:hypothetical protein